ncbi:MAG: hypothetical protein PHV23_00400 [Candidatus Gracilibacteria bacterium]|nr:hypothetical protein [Candidatus Gracilibacteria bacterium]
MNLLYKYRIDTYIIAFSIGLYIASKDLKLTITYLIGYLIYRFGNFIEKKVMDNLNLLIFLLIYFLFIYKNEINENITLLSLIGGIIAFWYGYKKYERDKELEIIEKYANKYNEINIELDNLKQDIENNKFKIKRKYEDLFNLFYEEFYLKSKGYISEELWNEWENWIEIDIYNFIDLTINKLFKIGDYDIFIGYIYGNYLQQYSNKNIKNEGLTFLDFIDKKLIKIKNDWDKEIKEKNMGYDDDIYNEKKEIVGWLDIIIKNNLKWKNNLKNN